MTDDVHLPVIHVVCPAGHRTGTRKASGRQMRCQRCFHELGKTVMLTVPDRTGSAGGTVPDRPAGPEPARLRCPFGHSFGTDMPPGSLVRCGECHQQGDVVTVTVPGGPPPSTDQPRSPKSNEWTGCSRCRAWSRRPPGAELPPGWLMLTVGVDPAVDPASRTSKTIGPFCGLVCATIALKGPRTGPDHLRTLMIEPPAGRDRR